LVGATQKISNFKFDFYVPVSISKKNHVVKPLKKGYNKCIILNMFGEEIGLYIVELEK